MAAKPTVGGSYNTYGTELNEFLDVGHDSDGTLKKSQALTDLGYSPTSYAGGESVTLPNGLIIKMGQVNVSASTDDTTVTFGTAFPNACISVVPAIRQSSGSQMTYSVAVFSIAKTSFHFALSVAANINGITWIAIGY